MLAFHFFPKILFSMVPVYNFVNIYKSRIFSQINNYYVIVSFIDKLNNIVKLLIQIFVQHGYHVG